MIGYLPNALTFARILAVPVCIWFMLQDRMTPAFWLFLAAGVTDAVDGHIARRFNARTVIGGYLDPLADKALLVSIFVVLGLMGYLPFWLTGLVVSRDLLIVAGLGILTLTGRTPRKTPLFISKVNTVAQIALAALVLADLGLAVHLTGLVEAFIWITAVTTLWSGLAYGILWSRAMHGQVLAPRGRKGD